MKFAFHGEIPPYLTAKDLILAVIGEIGVDGAHLPGHVLRRRRRSMRLTLEDRMTSANMAIEAGGKNGVCDVDEKTLRLRPRADRSKPFEPRSPTTPGAHVVFERRWDRARWSRWSPSPTRPTTRTRPATAGREADRAYIGSCTGGKITDFMIAAQILQGQQRQVDDLRRPRHHRGPDRASAPQMLDGQTMLDDLPATPAADLARRVVRRLPRRPRRHVRPPQRPRGLHLHHQPQLPRPHGREGGAGLPRLALHGRRVGAHRPHHRSAGVPAMTPPIIRGQVYVLGDNIDTDQIIPAQYLNLVPTIPDEYEKLGSYALVGLPSTLPPFVPPGRDQDAVHDHRRGPELRLRLVARARADRARRRGRRRRSSPSRTRASSSATASRPVSSIRWRRRSGCVDEFVHRRRRRARPRRQHASRISARATVLAHAARRRAARDRRRRALRVRAPDRHDPRARPSRRARSGAGESRRRGLSAAMAERELTVAVVGATGAVGREVLRTLEERVFPVGELRLFASARSAGALVDWRGGAVRVDQLDGDGFDGVDLAFFCAGGAISAEYAPRAVDAGRRRDRQEQSLPHAPRRAARRPRGERRGPRGAASRHRRQPELHDDPDRRRAEAASPTPSGSARIVAVELPGGVGRRKTRHRRALARDRQSAQPARRRPKARSRRSFRSGSPSIAFRRSTRSSRTARPRKRPR